MSGSAGKFDVIVVGGGLAGSSLSIVLARRGARVLVLERESKFRDRVRGEALSCWGVAEAKRLDIYDHLKAAGAKELRSWNSQLKDNPQPIRDLVATTPHACGVLTFYHPDVQMALLNVAEHSGAVVHRGVFARIIDYDDVGRVSAEAGDGRHVFSARLLVGADGRNSSFRARAGFQSWSDVDRLVLAGTLCDGSIAPRDAVSVYTNPDGGQCCIFIPVKDSCFRIYAGYYNRGKRIRLAGRESLRTFIGVCVNAGTPPEWLEGLRIEGPLACFKGADSWADRPAKRGIALIGDAAATSDPSWGCGMSLSLRDVRVLSDELLATDDWDKAVANYGAEHDRYYGALRRLTDWMTRLLRETGHDANVRRSKAFARLAEGLGRIPDLVGLGPDFPSAETPERKCFVEG